MTNRRYNYALILAKCYKSVEDIEMYVFTSRARAQEYAMGEAKNKALIGFKFGIDRITEGEPLSKKLETTKMIEVKL